MQRFSRRRIYPAAILIGLLAVGGTARADTAESDRVNDGIVRAIDQEQFMLRAASGARISELTEIARPKARDADTVAVASLEAGDATRVALAKPKLDFATLDAMPAAKGDAEMQCLAQAIYFESRGEPLDGQVAVAEVVLNRRDSRQFPSTVCGVTHQAGQFSYLSDGNSDVMRPGLAKSRSEKLASLMLAGRDRTMTDGALYFHTRSVRPDWSRRFARTTTIGHHIFYRPATQVAGG